MQPSEQFREQYWCDASDEEERNEKKLAKVSWPLFWAGWKHSHSGSNLSSHFQNCYVTNLKCFQVGRAFCLSRDLLYLPQRNRKKMFFSQGLNLNRFMCEWKWKKWKRENEMTCVSFVRWSWACNSFMLNFNRIMYFMFHTVPHLQALWTTCQRNTWIYYTMKHDEKHHLRKSSKMTSSFHTYFII